MATQPSFLPSAFAVSGDKNSIPASDGGTGAASYAQGFPPVTALPLMAGGVAPDRKDFNGILNILSQFAVFAQAGGTFAYSNTQNYDPGAIVNNNSGALYLCIAKNGPGTTAGVKALTNTSYWSPLMANTDVFTGATSGAAGTSGIVPAPAAGQQGKTLLGSGAWGQDPDVTSAKSAGQIGTAKTVTGAVDLDTYQTSGIYYFVWDSGSSNFPVGVGGYLIVITGSGSSLVRQVYFTNHASKAETYTRLYRGTATPPAWSAWVKYINYSDIFAGSSAGSAGAAGLVPAPAAGDQGKTLMGDGSWGQDAAVTSGLAVGELGGYLNIGGAADMNDYETAGLHVYFNSNSPSHQNWPSGAMSGANYLGGHMFVMRSGTASIVRQVFIPYLSARVDIYSRMKSSGGTWGSWALISSSGNVPGVNTAPIPNADPGDGIGRWKALNVETGDMDFNASSFVLPAGGTWAYMIFRSIRGAGINANGMGGCFCGIGAGGSTISPTFDASYSTDAWRGLTWRIA